MFSINAIFSQLHFGAYQQHLPVVNQNTAIVDNVILQHWHSNINEDILTDRVFQYAG